MLEWRDQGVVLASRRHGETSVILDVFAAEHGLHSGVVRGGTSRKRVASLQPGAQLDLVWKARLADHLGQFSVEPIRSRAATVMTSRTALAGLNAVCGLLCFSLPEREPQPRLYNETQQLLDLLAYPDAWPLAYLRWEMGLLESLGFGLDLSRCAVTGAQEDLIYVSPKSGRAVSRAGAGEWADRLLPLAAPMRADCETATDDEILRGLSTTGYFLEHHLAPATRDRALPDARARLLQVLRA